MSNSDDTSQAPGGNSAPPNLPTEGALAVAPAAAALESESVIAAPAADTPAPSPAPTLTVVPDAAPTATTPEAAPNTAVASTPAAAPAPSPAPAVDEGPLYPTIVFAVEKGFPQAQVEKQFSDEGMTLIFAKTEEDVTKYVGRPETYVVFIGIEFAKNGIMLMRRLMVQTQAYWVMVTGHLSTQKRSALLNAGAVDLLVHPVGAAQYKLRAKGLLGRYLKSYEMPKEVILPQGFHRKEDAAARSEGGNNANSEKGYSHRTGEAGKDNNQGYGHRSGDGADKPEMRMHDLSRDKEGPGYKHHSSKDDPSNPEWRAKFGADEEGADWRNKLSADDPSNPAWRQHSAERLQAEAEAKRIAADAEKAAAWNSHAASGNDKPADWKNHGSAADPSPAWRNNAIGPDGKPVEWRGAGKQAGEDTPPAWNNSQTPNGAPVRGASSVVSMSTPESKEFSARQEAEKAAAWRNGVAAPDTAPSFRRLEGETDAQYAERMAATQPQHRSGDMPASANAPAEFDALRPNVTGASTDAPPAAKPAVPTGPLKEIREPLSLLEAIRAKIVLLSTDTPWDPKIWKDLQPLVASQFQGMERSLADLSKLFRDACAVLGAKRITLVSFRPALLLENFPAEVVALVSSDADPRHNEQVASLLFPQLQVAYEEAAPFLLDEALPVEIGGRRRPDTWCINGHNEKMAALLPVISDRKVAMSLFIQFDRSGTPELHKLLEQAVSYFREPEKHYNLLDFISRVYREAK